MKQHQAVLLHFGGGNSYSFQFILSRLSGYDVLTPELPGRGRRHQEALLTRFDDAAADLYRQIDPWLNGMPYIIYGHSMGAYLALRMVNMLEASGRMPAYLIVSGNAGPGAAEPKGRFRMSRVEFIKELEMLGGIPEELLLDEELFSFFEPILRADFEISEYHGLIDETPVSAPIFALMGSREHQTNNIVNWQRFTRGQFDAEIWEGDHFFIHHHAGRLAALLSGCVHGAIKQFNR